jgi:hypothetical protein
MKHRKIHKTKLEAQNATGKLSKVVEMPYSDTFIDIERNDGISTTFGGPSQYSTRPSKPAVIVNSSQKANMTQIIK